MYQYRANHAVFSGRRLHVSWSTLLGDRINAGLAVVNGLVYTDSFDHRVYALDATSGRIVWSAPTSNIVMSTPVLSEGVVLVGTGHNGFLRPTDASSLVWGRPEGDDVEAYDAETGVNRWSFHTIGEDMPSMALSRGIAVFANGDLHAYGLHPGDGTLMWSRRLPGIASMMTSRKML